MSSIALLIVHSDRLVRESLSAVLTQQDQLVVVDTIDSLDDAAAPESLRAQRADVVILDVALARRCTPGAIQQLKRACPEAKVLIMGIDDRDADILAAFELGATGYVTQNSSIRELVANVRALKFGQTICSARIANMMFARAAHQVPAAPATSVPHAGVAPRLTRREAQVVALIEAGLTNKEIGRRLSLEVQTVKNHVHNILDKLQVPRRIDAVRFARAHGLLSSVTMPLHVERERSELAHFQGAIALGADLVLKN